MATRHPITKHDVYVDRNKNIIYDFQYNPKVRIEYNTVGGRHPAQVNRDSFLGLMLQEPGSIRAKNIGEWAK